MTELSYPWDVVARLQQKLSQSTSENRQTKALEAVLDLLTSGSPPPQEEFERAYATARRRERHRHRLELEFLHPPETVPAHSSSVHARITLESIQKQLLKEDWELLLAVGLGRSYKDIAKFSGDTPGRLRTKTTRLRQNLAMYRPNSEPIRVHL